MMLTRSQVKYIQSLNEKKFRKEEEAFIAEGPKIINELLDTGRAEPVALYATASWWQQNSALQQRLPPGTCTEISGAELDRISFLSTPNQVLGVFRQPSFPEPLPYNGTVTLVLDGIQDPGNFGTIIRIADWFGIRQVIAATNAADVFNPKVVQSTMGSIARVKVTYGDLPTIIALHPAVPVYASTLHGNPLGTFGKIQEGFLLIGNESKGLSSELVHAARHQVTIPKYGHAESLNAAVATGIMLSHLIG